MNNNLLRFDGQVAIVTGAGGGLGREYALSLAERGASVVVNDLGGTRSGEGQNKSAADRVVDEIRSKRGKAVADYNSVEDGDKIVKTAIDNFGRIDIVINNAGILRDKSLLKITTDDWDLVHRVHLRGSFLVTKAAWPYFRKQNYGRIIVTSSGAGIYGNFGQSNYGSAKLGLLGLGNTLAIEGAKYGIHCNTIVPLAASRLTQDIFPEDWIEQLKPEFISPVVVYLCHNSCPENGGVFEAAGGWVGKYRWQRSIGKAFVGKGDKISPESVRDNWQEITDMTDATSPANVTEQTTLLVEALTSTKEGKTRIKKDVGGYSYNHDHAILYALGVGLTTAEPDHLRFLYEGSDEFQVLPTFGSVISMHALLESPVLHEQLEGIKADPTKMVHGEQYLEVYEPLPPSATLTSTCNATAVLDKGAGALVIVDVDSYNEQGIKVMRNQFSIFFLGAGGFGGPRNSDKVVPIAQMPSRQPDAVVFEKTMNNQAALFRLCGDKNPLHIDPSFSAMGGFPKPILHGLCTYGYAGRHVLKQFANNDVKKFKNMKARFTGPIEPGHTIKTEMWREGNRIIYQCIAVETGKPLVTGGYVELEAVTPLYAAPSQPNSNNSANEIPLSSSGGGGDNPHNSNGLISDLIFAEIGKKLKELPDIAKKVQAIYEWNITKGGKPAAQWILDLKNGTGDLYRGPIKEGKAHCTLTIDDDDMLSMVTGKLDARKAFMSGRLKIKGNIMLTQKLQPLLAANRDKANIQVPKQAAPAAPQASSTPSAALKSDVVFAGYQKSLERNPQFVEIQHIYQWNITKDGKVAAVWTFDLKNGNGSVYRGPPKQGKADCILTLDDDLMVGMSAGQVDPQKAFMSGKLKIQGDVLASERLHDMREDFKNRMKSKSDQPEDNGTSTAQPSNEPPICVKSDIIFELFGERLLEEPDIANKMKVIYHWNVFRDGKKMSDWTVDLKTGSGAIYKSTPKTKADCILTLEDEDTIRLLTGKLNPQRAFMTGKLKIKGNIMLTQKLNQLWQEILKSGRAVELPLLEPILIDKALDPRLYSEYAFLALTKKLARNPDLVDKVNTVFEWNITKDGKKETTWTLDMKKPLGAIYRGPSKGDKATCTITIDDRDFSELVLGRLPAEQALSRGGRIQISGDASAVDKVTQLFKVSASKL